MLFGYASYKHGIFSSKGLGEYSPSEIISPENSSKTFIIVWFELEICSGTFSKISGERMFCLLTGLTELIIFEFEFRFRFKFEDG